MFRNPTSQPNRDIEWFLRCGRGAVAFIFLLWLAWQAFNGGLRQMSRARKLGQQIETVIQLQCALLSLLVALTGIWPRPLRWAETVRQAWRISFVVSAGLSALVWGPAMPHVAILFMAGTFLLAQVILQALKPKPAI